MLITYVQAAPNADGSFHIQATGPAFPQGYTSGDLTLNEIEKDAVFIPSMRGSERLYFQLSQNEVSRNLVAIVTALHAPRPAYSASDVQAVQTRVQAALDTATGGAKTPVYRGR